MSSEVESNGATTVWDVGSQYWLITNAGVVTLKFANINVMPGQFAGWTLIGAEKTASGYEVAWKTAGTNPQYTVWNTDSGGNYVSTIGVVSANSTALESLEPSFQQDLNGDGTTGLASSVIETVGSTKLVQVADQYFMYAVGGSTGPAVKLNGAAVTLGQMGPWTAIGATQTASGYEVAWKLAGADTYTVWYTDGSGNYLSNIGAVSGNSAVLKALEADFQQNLNGDGVIGLTTTTVLDAFGSTKLVQSDNNYFLFPVGGSSGPALRISGAPVVAGQTFGWTPIGAEQTASGYEVAWKLDGAAPQYTVWYTDSGGNYLSSPIGVVAGNSALLKALEPSFQQDLNLDGVTGLTTTPIEALGSTKLVQGDSNYFLFPVGGSSGPALKISGAPVVAGQTFGWTPIGAEQTASGYEIAWKLDGAAPQYTVWYTDSGGNYLSSPIGVVAGNSALLKALEPSFQQDLNDDGVTGLTSTTVIEALGSTKLVQGDSNYFLFPVAGSSGPPLRFGGAAVTAGQFGAWTPIGAEQTASGYEIAWRFGGADQYTVWFTDGAGNYLSSPFGGVSGSNSALQLLEPSFQQDLNGDGVTGLLVEMSGSTRLTQVGNNYFMDPVAGGSGPALKMNGLPVAADQFGSWRAIGAERTASGYEVAFKVTGADQFTVWNTDSSGNYLSNTSVASGFSTAMESLEPSFQQDLNGDGVTGIAARVVEAFGSTQLVQVADQYFMYPVGGVSGPGLKLNGAPLTTSQLGTWTVIGAEWDASLGGYQVALKVTGADQYTVWHADQNGNYWASFDPLGVVTGDTPEFEALETTFHQDLNRDGIIGLPPTFDITVHYTGDSTYQSYFTAAAQRWSQVITADLPNVDDFQLGFIDDLLIDVDVHFIDGAGKTLGQSRADEFRSGSAGLPYHGTIELDSADLSTMASNGTLFSVILHEMGHVLGLGSLWSRFGLTVGSQYIGTNGVNAYHQLGGANFVPLETGGGSGTALVHWSESTFGTELMTGFTNGLPGQLSILTIGSLQDLGYTVNYGAADPYSLPGHLQAGAFAAASMDAPASASDRDGSLALLTNAMASAFVTPAGEGAGTVAAAQSPGPDFLTKPAA